MKEKLLNRLDRIADTLEPAPPLSVFFFNEGEKRPVGDLVFEVLKPRSEIKITKGE